jgi:hypothetical protein
MRRANAVMCPNCGKELPDDANFCISCGRLQKAGLTVPILRTKYELCEIDYFVEEGFLNRKGLFGAVELGTQRKHLFGESESFLLSFEQMRGVGYWGPKQILTRTSEAFSVFNALVDRLVDEGWEQTGWGHFWYSEQLRRRVERIILTRT